MNTFIFNRIENKVVGMRNKLIILYMFFIICTSDYNC